MLDVHSIAIVLTALAGPTMGEASTSINTGRTAVQSVGPSPVNATVSKRDRLSAIGVPNRCGPKGCG